MQATYDTSGEAGGAGPFLAETEVIGFYRPEQAAAATRTSMTLVTDQSLGQWRQNDDEPARPMSDGTPPPGSQPMNKETADWYMKITGGSTRCRQARRPRATDEPNRADPHSPGRRARRRRS